MFPVIENSISLGNIITILVVLGSVMTFIYNMKGSIEVIRNDVRHLQESHKALTEAFTQLGAILTKVAVQDTRLNMIDKRLDELSHGDGLVLKK